MKRNIVFLFIFITWGFTCAWGELFPDSDDFFMMSQLMRGACNHAAGTGHSPGPGPAQRLAATSGAGSGVGGSFNSLLTPLLIDKLMDLRAPPARPSPGNPESGTGLVNGEPHPEYSHHVDIISGRSNESVSNATAEFSPLIFGNDTLENSTSSNALSNASTTLEVGIANITLTDSPNTVVATLSPPETLPEPATLAPATPIHPQKTIEIGGAADGKVIRRISPIMRKKRSLAAASNGTFQSPSSRASWISPADALNTVQRNIESRQFANFAHQSGQASLSNAGSAGYGTANFGNQQQAHSQLLIPQASFQYSQVALNGQPLTGAGAGFNNGANGAVGGSFVSQGQNTGSLQGNFVNTGVPDVNKFGASNSPHTNLGNAATGTRQYGGSGGSGYIANQGGSGLNNQQNSNFGNYGSGGNQGNYGNQGNHGGNFGVGISNGNYGAANSGGYGNSGGSSGGGNYGSATNSGNSGNYGGTGGNNGGGNVGRTYGAGTGTGGNYGTGGGGGSYGMVGGSGGGNYGASGGNYGSGTGTGGSYGSNVGSVGNSGNVGSTYGSGSSGGYGLTGFGNQGLGVGGYQSNLGGLGGLGMGGYGSGIGSLLGLGGMGYGNNLGGLGGYGNSMGGIGGYNGGLGGIGGYMSSGIGGYGGGLGAGYGTSLGGMGGYGSSMGGIGGYGGNLLGGGIGGFNGGMGGYGSGMGGIGGYGNSLGGIGGYNNALGGLGGYGNNMGTAAYGTNPAGLGGYGGQLGGTGGYGASLGGLGGYGGGLGGLGGLGGSYGGLGGLGSLGALGGYGGAGVYGSGFPSSMMGGGSYGSQLGLGGLAGYGVGQQSGFPGGLQYGMGMQLGGQIYPGTSFGNSVGFSQFPTAGTGMYGTPTAGTGMYGTGLQSGFGGYGQTSMQSPQYVMMQSQPYNSGSSGFLSNQGFGTGTATIIQGIPVTATPVSSSSTSSPIFPGGGGIGSVDRSSLSRQHAFGNFEESPSDAFNRQRSFLATSPNDIQQHDGNFSPAKWRFEQNTRNFNK